MADILETHPMKQALKKLYVLLMRRRFGAWGKNSYLSPFGTYLEPEKIFIGDNVYIGPRAMISVSERITIGHGVTIGPEFMAMGGDHNFRKVGCWIHQLKTGGENRPIVIENDVWIGARVLILKGVTIGEGAIIGAGSVVTKNILPYTVNAGNPARRIGVRFRRDELTQHLEAVSSKYQADDLNVLFYGA